MEEKYVALAIPFFLLMMAVEALVSRKDPHGPAPTAFAELG